MGVIPFRSIGDENLEFLIVTTKNGNWGLPKREPDEKTRLKKNRLAREAYEEQVSSDQLWIKKFLPN